MKKTKLTKTIYKPTYEEYQESNIKKTLFSLLFHYFYNMLQDLQLYINNWNIIQIWKPTSNYHKHLQDTLLCFVNSSPNSNLPFDKCSVKISKQNNEAINSSKIE